MAWKKAQKEKAEAEKNKAAEGGASAPEGGTDDGPPKPSKPLSEMSMAE